MTSVLVSVRARLPWLLAAAVLCLLLQDLVQDNATHWFAPVAGWSGYRKDFTAFYAAAAMISRGSGSAIYHTNAIAGYEVTLIGHPVGDYGYTAYFNPPAFAALLTPLTLVSLERAYQLWTAFNIALVALNVWMLWQVARPLTTSAKLLLSIAFITFLPVVDALLLGQFSLILLTSWAAAYLLLRSRRDVLAGAVLGLLVVKPEMLLPVTLLLLLQRRWRAFLGLAPAVGAAALLSVGVIGVTEALRYPAYVANSMSSPAAASSSNAMYDWNGILAMLWTHPESVPAARLAIAALSIGSLAVLALHARRRGKRVPASFASQWMLLTLVTLLVDPHLYLQDTVLLSVPAVALYAGASGRQRHYIAAMIAYVWLLVTLGPLPNERAHIDLLALSEVAAMLALLWYQFRAPAQQRVRAAPALNRVAQP